MYIAFQIVYPISMNKKEVYTFVKELNNKIGGLSAIVTGLKKGTWSDKAALNYVKDYVNPSDIERLSQL